MALDLNAKKAIVKEVSQVAQKSISLAVADYRGLTVPALTALRQAAREKGVYLRVIRNTLARQAFKGTDFMCMNDALVGPLLFGFAEQAPGAVAQLFKDFAKSNQSLKVKALSVAGQFYDASHLEAIAALPSREQALGLLARTLLAPARQWVRTLVEPHTQLVRALDAYRQQH